MSMHRTHAHMTGLNEALKQHHLVHDKPSQLADGFRCGWLAYRLQARLTLKAELQAVQARPPSQARDLLAHGIRHCITTLEESAC